MNPNDKLAVRVGGVVLILAVAGVIGMIVFGNATFGPRTQISIHFGHMAGLQEHADVHLAGNVVGRVTALRLVPAASMPEDHPLYPFGGVTADVSIDRSQAKRAAVNGEFFVSSKGVLGKAYIEIGPPPNDAPVSRPIRQGDQIRGVDPPVLDRAIYNAIYNLNVSRQFILELGPHAGEMADSLDELNMLLDEILPESTNLDAHVSDFRSFASELLRIVDGTGDLARLDNVLIRARRLSASASQRITRAQADILAVHDELQRVARIVPPDLKPKFELIRQRIDRNLARFDEVLAAANQLLGFIKRGEGTIGAIGNDPEFSDEARELGKILKRQPWKLIGHPGNRKPEFGKTPQPPDM